MEHDEPEFLISYQKIKSVIGEICLTCDDDHKKSCGCSSCALDFFEDILGDLFQLGQEKIGKAFILT